MPFHTPTCGRQALHSPPIRLREKASANKLVGSYNKCLFKRFLLFFNGVHEPRTSVSLPF